MLLKLEELVWVFWCVLLGIRLFFCNTVSWVQASLFSQVIQWFGLRCWKDGHLVWAVPDLFIAVLQFKIPKRQRMFPAAEGGSSKVLLIHMHRLARSFVLHKWFLDAPPWLCRTDTALLRNAYLGYWLAKQHLFNGSMTTHGHAYGKPCRC